LSVNVELKQLNVQLKLLNVQLKLLNVQLKLLSVQLKLLSVQQSKTGTVNPPPRLDKIEIVQHREIL
jgi:hypothetical protein